MPRKSRIDAAGALHHITVRGIERGTVFRNDKGRDHFLCGSPESLVPLGGEEIGRNHVFSRKKARDIDPGSE
jgi:hypothetical protein